MKFKNVIFTGKFHMFYFFHRLFTCFSHVFHPVVLEHSLSQLASVALPCTKPKDFKLIKESKNYHNVYCKIYMHYSGTPKCYYSELVNSCRRTKPLEDAAFENFKGSCIVRIIHAFSGKTKSITICADEIINYDSQESYFDEFPEE